MFPLSSKPLYVIAAKSFTLHNLAKTAHIHLDDSQQLAKASHLMSSRGNGWSIHIRQKENDKNCFYLTMHSRLGKARLEANNSICSLKYTLLF